MDDVDFQKVAPKCFERKIINPLKNYKADPIPGDIMKKIWNYFPASLKESIEKECKK